MERSRRLAAIMFTDIEGYTALMQKSEAKAIEVRNRHRAIFEGVTDRHKGSIIQYYGDGTLSIFESAVQAVLCATEMQKQFRTEPAIPVRIGIHMGDIVVTDEDIIGDAVNLASRVESLAISGSVLVSAKVVTELKSHPQIQVESQGKFHFKNDEKAREIFAVNSPDLIIPRRSQLKGKTKKQTRNIWKPLGLYLTISWVFIQLFHFIILKNNWDQGLLDLIIILLTFSLPTVLIVQWFEAVFCPPSKFKDLAG